MKVTKWALLAGAAIAVTATAARADDLSALKAEIEALQSRVSQLEAQPQASMPSGYSLLSIRDGQGTYEGVLAERNADKARENSGFTLSVLPTADAAPAAEVSVSGEIRTALIYTDIDEPGHDDNLDVKVRGRLFVKGKADTAVGEVGGYLRLQADGGGDFGDYSESTKFNKAYGWWKFAPSWELMAGYNDNTGALQVGWDWMAATGPVNSFGPSNINNEQFRLTYSSGPLSFAISVEDADNFSSSTTTGTGVFVPTGCVGGDAGADGDCTDAGESILFTEETVTTTESGDTSDLPNLQAYIMYSSDSFTAQLAGLFQTDDAGDEDDWAIGGGANLGIADGFQLTAGGVFGEGTSSYANNIGPTVDEEFWAASVGLIASLSEDTRLELGAGIEDYDDSGEATGFGGGIYWDPVSQVTLGAGATYVDFDNDAGDADSLQVFFGTWLRFP